MEILNDILNSVGNLGTGAMVVAAVIVIGYVIKAIPQIPCGLIPLFTLVAAVTANVLLGDVSVIDYKARHPEVRLGMIGLLYWGIGWLLHNQGLSRLEKFLPGPLRALLGVESPTPPKDPPASDPMKRNDTTIV